MPRSVKHGGKKVFKFREHRNTSKAKNKAFKKKKVVSTKCKQLAEEWDHSKTTQSNLSAFGLAYDANKVLPLVSDLKVAEEEMEVEEGDITEMKKLGSISLQKKAKEGKTTSKALEALEAEANAMNAHNKRIGRKAKLLDRDIEFCVYMLAKHGEDYKAMARDPRNIFQDNPKQLEKKIRIYKQTSYYKAIECAEDQ